MATMQIAIERETPPHRVLDQRTLGDHLDRLFRAAWALCGSREEAEDLVRETYARVLTRPRPVRGDARAKGRSRDDYSERGRVAASLRSDSASRDESARDASEEEPDLTTTFTRRTLT
jgi:DNA-directed RNA polymerase specialized sigma24 family protein